MIVDNGFEIVSDFSADALINQAEAMASQGAEQPVEVRGKSALKTLSDLRPSQSS